MMKILLTLFVLLFSASVLAEDISDFKIRKMSVGDSMLDYYGRNQIKNLKNLDHLPSDMKFRIAYFYESKLADKYDMIQFTYKPKDKNFIVTGASGGIGNSIAEKLHEQGANVLATGTRIEKLEELAKKFNGIKTLKFDISQHEKIEEFINEATEKLGG